MKRTILTLIVVVGALAVVGTSAYSLYGQSIGTRRRPTVVPTDWSAVTPPTTVDNYRTDYRP